jgi:hypothetical protein
MMSLAVVFSVGCNVSRLDTPGGMSISCPQVEQIDFRSHFGSSDCSASCARHELAVGFTESRHGRHSHSW